MKYLAFILPALSICCAADGGPDDGAPYPAAQRCIASDGSIEWIDLSGVSDLLADDDALAAAVGFETVDNCEDATRTLRQRSELLEAGPSADGPLPSYPDASAEDEFRIRGGTNSGHPGAVEVVMDMTGIKCTGILISPVAVITSAHCLEGILSPANPEDEAALTQVRLSYRRPGATDTWQCLTPGLFSDQANGKCAATSQQAAVVVMHGPYVGGYDAQSDIAVVINPTSQWTGVDNDDFVRVWADSFSRFDRFEVWGRGANAFSTENSGDGVMRTGGFGLDWYGTHHFYALARTPRICKGDSGGPAIWDDAGLHPYALGITTTMDVPRTGTQQCAEKGGKQRFTRLSTKIDWVGDQIRTFRPSAPQCAPHPDGVLGGVYQKCF